MDNILISWTNVKRELAILALSYDWRGSVMVKVLEFSALYFGNADIPQKGIASKPGIVKENQLHIYEDYWFSSGTLCQCYINALWLYCPWHQINLQLAIDFCLGCLVPWISDWFKHLNDYSGFTFISQNCMFIGHVAIFSFLLFRNMANPRIKYFLISF